jgi:hypothetical protein
MASLSYGKMGLALFFDLLIVQQHQLRRTIADERSFVGHQQHRTHFIGEVARPVQCNAMR